MARRVDLIRVNHYVTYDCQLLRHYSTSLGLRAAKEEYKCVVTTRAL
jgi:hypothetical protein